MRFLFALAAFLLLPALAPAQARATAQQGVRLQVYALPTYVRPDYRNGTSNAGAILGINILAQRYFGLFDPSLDLRAMGSGGSVSNQFVYGFAPHLALHLPRVQPYAEYLIADGSIHFHNAPDPNYTHDSSLVTGPGGGADIDIDGYWSLRVEATHQRWQLSHLTPPFHPVSVSVGVRYQFHFKGKGGPQ